MKIAVIGAGVIGVTTAYELAVDGHDVTVLERCGAVAEMASFANAGVIAPGCVGPWSSPNLTRALFNHSLNRPNALGLRLPLTGTEWRWLWRASRSEKSDVGRSSRRTMQRLASYSRERLDYLVESLSLEFEASQGLLVLLRSDKEHKRAKAELRNLHETGFSAVGISAVQARELEPALSAETKLYSAIHLPNDGVANCRQFALLLRRKAELLGVNFEFNSTVAPLDTRRPAFLSITSNRSTESINRIFDCVVMCAGVGTQALVKPLGVNLPVTRVFGYSVSATIGEAMNAPRSAVIDERYKVAISRLGQRVRVSGATELGGDTNVKHLTSLQLLYKVLQDWFPGAALFSGSDPRAGRNLGAGVQEWKGAFPTTPDGPPFIGDSRIPGVWLNVGHGAHGWAMACGSARALADMMAGKVPQIDTDGFGVDRLR